MNVSTVSAFPHNADAVKPTWEDWWQGFECFDFTKAYCAEYTDWVGYDEYGDPCDGSECHTWMRKCK